LEWFTAWVDGLEQSASSAPALKWPPPDYPPKAFDYFVEIVLQTNTAKGLDLCKGIVRSLNDANYLCFAVLLRAFFEQVLLIHEYWTDLWLPKIVECSRKGQIQVEDFRGLISELHMSVRRSQIDWESFLSGRFESVKDEDGTDKVRLNKAAAKWTAAGKKLGALSPSALYSVLCDFGHPNFGSALLCVPNQDFGFSKAPGLPVGGKVFAILYPSLAALCNELKKALIDLEMMKFKQD